MLEGGIVTGNIRIERLETIGPREIDGLSDMLVDCVEGGASVSFMWPMTRDKADRFWRAVAERRAAAGNAAAKSRTMR